MIKTIRCPCCNKQIRVLYADGEISIFFVAENYDLIPEILEENNIEFGAKGGET